MYSSRCFAILTIALVILTYYIGLNGAFFFDDGPSILLAPGVQLESLSWEQIREAWQSGGSGPTGRPIAQFTFALNYFFSGFNPLAFKATNLSIHIACGALVWAVTQRTISATQSRAVPAQAQWVSGAVTLVWLLHPIQLLPVLHVVQRMTSLSALFLLFAFFLHIVGRDRGGRVGAIWLLLAWSVMWPLSCLSKETGILLPGFVLAWELIIRRTKVGHLDTFARVMLTLAVLVAVAVGGYLLSASAHWLWAGYSMRPFSMAERLLTEGRVLWLYLGLIVFPRLSSFALYHDDIALSTGWFTPWTTLPAVAGLVLLLGAACLLRRRAPLVSFGIVWFFIGHSMESTVLPLEIAHEHRNYLPLWGVLLAGTGTVLALVQRRQPLSQSAMRGTLAIGGLLFLSMTSITALRANQFGDEVRRTLLAAQYQPRSALAQFDAANTLARLPSITAIVSPFYERAHAYYNAANSLNPDIKVASLGLLYLYCKTGQVPPEREVDELRRRLRSTPFAPGDRTVLYSLKEMSIAGTLCLERSQVDSFFVAAISNDTVSPDVRSTLYSWYADYLWLHARDMNAARTALSQSLTLNPDNPSNRLKWAQLLFLSQEREASAQILIALKDARLSREERETRRELLVAHNIQSP